MRSRAVWLIPALCLLLLPALSVAESEKEIRNAILDAYDELHDALAKGDAKRVVDNLYTKDAELYFIGSAVMRGRDQLRKHWQYLIDMDRIHFYSSIEEIIPADDMALETGHCKVYDRRGNEIFKFRFMTVWKKEGGAWKMHRDMANVGG